MKAKISFWFLSSVISFFDGLKESSPGAGSFQDAETVTS